MGNEYVMTISRTTIDKLGIKLYDTASDAIGEIISNSYDADAENVIIEIPLGVYLASKKHDVALNELGYEITIKDDGHGMRPKDINDFFLSVGLERRTDDRRKNINVIGSNDESAGNLSLEKRRHVTGRKGIGKLAPFGICREIEVWSAGGKKGDPPYDIAHLILDYDKINTPTDEKYRPLIGPEDGKQSDTRGTRITLRKFLYRKTPSVDVFLRQLARKFSLGTPDFQIKIIDTKTKKHHEVTKLNIEVLERTRMDFKSEPIADGSLPVSGWVAYSKTPFQNVEMAGVRIYARGKLAAITRDFGHNAGFTGEYTIRSYLVGEIHADWLDADDDEDLIASDRQDILWSTEKGQALQCWGQKILKQLGTTSVGPLNQRAYEKFLEISNYEDSARKLFGDTAVYDSAMKVIRVIGRMVSMQNLQDEQHVERVKNLALMITPHSMIVERLRRIPEGEIDSSLNLLEALLCDVRLAEASSLGQVAIERINAISTLDEAIHQKPNPPESTLQKILEASPWLIHPEWTIFQSNATLGRFRESFERWYEDQTGRKTATNLDPAAANKRPDFIMLSMGRSIEIIEIKAPGHAFASPDFHRMHLYIEKLSEYLELNPKFKEDFHNVRCTLVCDRVALEGVDNTAYESLGKDPPILTQKTWDELLEDVKKSNEDFLKAKDKLIELESRHHAKNHAHAST